MWTKVVTAMTDCDYRIGIEEGLNTIYCLLRTQKCDTIGTTSQDGHKIKVV